MDPANAEAYRVHALQCFACAARDARAKDFEEDEHADNRQGLYLSVSKKPRRA